MLFRGEGLGKTFKLIPRTVKPEPSKPTQEPEALNEEPGAWFQSHQPKDQAVWDLGLGFRGLGFRVLALQNDQLSLQVDADERKRHANERRISNVAENLHLFGF